MNGTVVRAVHWILNASEKTAGPPLSPDQDYEAVQPSTEAAPFETARELPPWELTMGRDVCGREWIPAEVS